MRVLLLLSISLVTVNLLSASIEPAHSRPHRKFPIGRHTVAGIVGSAAIGQATNRPHEWGRGGAGFGKRLGSGAAHYVVKDTIQRGVGGLLHEQRNSFVRADKPGFGPKFKAAAESTFMVRHKNSNKRYVAAGRLSGDLGSGMISRLWQPAALHTVSSGLATGGISVGADFGYNLAREYMPAHKRRRIVRYHVTTTHRRYTRSG